MPCLKATPISAEVSVSASRRKANSSVKSSWRRSILRLKSQSRSNSKNKRPRLGQSKLIWWNWSRARTAIWIWAAKLVLRQSLSPQRLWLTSATWVICFPRLSLKWKRKSITSRERLLERKRRCQPLIVIRRDWRRLVTFQPSKRILSTTSSSISATQWQQRNNLTRSDDWHSNFN